MANLQARQPPRPPGPAYDALGTGGKDLQRRVATKDEMQRDPTVFRARRTVAISPCCESPAASRHPSRRKQLLDLRVTVWAVTASPPVWPVSEPRGSGPRGSS